MDEMQEGVIPAEPTVETESPTVEYESTDTQEAPVVESNDTAENVSKTVPYDRFKQVNDELRNIKEMLQYQQAPAQQETVQPAEFDQDVAVAIQQQARAVYEQNEAARFEAKHAKEFDKDPLLRGAFMVEAQGIMAKGQYVDREAVLERAKAMLESRIKPATQAAKAEGLQEGKQIAQTKQQLGAVGETGTQPKADPSQMSAAEMAKYYNLPRYN